MAWPPPPERVLTKNSVDGFTKGAGARPSTLRMFQPQTNRPSTDTASGSGSGTAGNSIPRQACTRRIYHNLVPSVHTPHEEDDAVPGPRLERPPSAAWLADALGSLDGPCRASESLVALTKLPPFFFDAWQGLVAASRAAPRSLAASFSFSSSRAALSSSSAAPRPHPRAASPAPVSSPPFFFFFATAAATTTAAAIAAATIAASSSTECSASTQDRGPTSTAHGASGPEGETAHGPQAEDRDEVVNWSATHACYPQRVVSPESVEELEATVLHHHRSNQRLRVIGSALSPNGIGFSDETLLSVANLDRILHVDKDNMEVWAAGSSQEFCICLLVCLIDSIHTIHPSMRQPACLSIFYKPIHPSLTLSLFLRLSLSIIQIDAHPLSTSPSLQPL